jgi:NAD(P)H-dependent flavin oxidoreductase YrpB (nitropropane dioxygenase family)
LAALIDVIIEEKTKLFICAVGVPPKAVVDKLHKAGIIVMNMMSSPEAEWSQLILRRNVGHPKHCEKAIAMGVDLICCQGGEGGGHTGDVPTFILVGCAPMTAASLIALQIPACVDICKKYKSPLTGEPVQVVAAGGIVDGRGLAASLAFGATGVWVGTRFVCAEEAGASPVHQEAVMTAGFDDSRSGLDFRV